MLSPPSPLSLGSWAACACLLEVQAPKAGNVHPTQAFADLDWLDFALAAAAIGPVFDRAPELSLGQLVLQSIQATRQVAATNVNLGIVLLLAPLAQVPATALGSPTQYRQALGLILERATVADAEAVYEAIRLAAPAGMGQAPRQDVQQTPTLPLRAVMKLACRRDLVARQYANGFHDVLGFGLKQLKLSLKREPLSSAIVTLHLAYLAKLGDSLIQRKLGPALSQQTQRQARTILEAGWPGSSRSRRLFERFDAWLRADGHRRNPGSTADLVAATLFAAFRLGLLKLPLQHAWG